MSLTSSSSSFISKAGKFLPRFLHPGARAWVSLSAGEDDIEARRDVRGILQSTDIGEARRTVAGGGPVLMRNALWYKKKTKQNDNTTCSWILIRRKTAID